VQGAAPAAPGGAVAVNLGNQANMPWFSSRRARRRRRAALHL